MSGDFNEREKERPKKVDDEDSRLKNWNSWIEQWKTVQDQLMGGTVRKEGELLMNSTLGLRSIMEERILIDSARIPTYFDKYRGQPDFWKLPVALSRKSDGEPDYFAIKTDEEGYILPKIEQVGLPTMILIEKNLMNATRDMYVKWQSSGYRQQQIKKYRNKIKNILPHKADMKLLAVKGQKIKLHPPEEPEIGSTKTCPESKCSPETPEKDKSEIPDDPERKKWTLPPIPEFIPELPKRILEINDLTFCEEFETTGSRKFYINLDYDISKKRPVGAALLLKNPGHVTLRIRWKKIDKFKLIAEDHFRKDGFYFNHNEFLLLPKDIFLFPFYFKSSLPGNYVETWEISTLPALWQENLHVLVILQCYAFFGDSKKKAEEILKKIDEKSKEIKIKDILGDIVQKVSYKDSPKTPCVFEENQIFEMANLFKDRPRFRYDFKIINQLKLFYENMAGEQSLAWNLSIESLKKLAHFRDMRDYLEMKRSEAAGRMMPQVVKSIAAITKGKGKKGKSEKSSKKSAKSKSSNKKGKKGLGDKEKSKIDLAPVEPMEKYVHSHKTELNEVLKNLESPTTTFLQRRKYFACYKAVSAYFSKMESLLDDVDKEFGVERQSNYPKYTSKLVPQDSQPERMIYEKFDDNDFVAKPLKLEKYGYEAKPKPAKLKEVPDDNPEMLYSIYFDRPIDDGKKDKKSKKKDKGKKGAKESKKSKSTKSSKKDKKSKSKEKKPIVKKEPELVIFDPYTEEFEYVPETEQTETSGISENPQMTPKKQNEMNYKSYLVVHSCLSEAVDAVIDTVNSYDCIVNYGVFDEVQKYSSSKD